MPQSLLRILIAETHYLIAMEVERMLSETMSCVTAIVPLARLKFHIAAEPYDVVVLDAAPSKILNIARARAIVEIGATPVFLSSYERYPDDAASMCTYPVVAKPLDPDSLAEAVRWAALQVPSGAIAAATGGDLPDRSATDL